MLGRYAIIATLGPSTSDEQMWDALLAAGATGFRLNTSHLKLDALCLWLERLVAWINNPRRWSAFPAVVGESAPGIWITLDLQGSKWRLGEFAPFEIAPGRTVELVLAESADRTGVLPVPHADFFRAAICSTGEIVLDDAKTRLAVEAVRPDGARATVLQGSELFPRKGITLTGADLRAETLSQKDQAILRQTESFDFVRYAISYVKDAAEMAVYRTLCPAKPLVAKIERATTVAEAAQIAALANEVWLCRGDLGAEVGLAAMAEAVHRFGEQMKALPVPALLAGQVFEHMTAHPLATRAEICGLYDALQRGYAGVVLSDETAIGHYPLESVRMAALFDNRFS